MKRMTILKTSVCGFFISFLLTGYASSEESCTPRSMTDDVTVSDVVTHYRLNVEPTLTNEISVRRDITLEIVNSSAISDILEEQLNLGTVSDESKALTKSYLSESFLERAHVIKLSSQGLRDVFYVTERDVSARFLMDAFIIQSVSDLPKPVGWHTIGDLGTATGCSCVAVFTTPIDCDTCTETDQVGSNSLKDALEERFSMTTQPIEEFIGREVVSTRLPDITIESLER